MKQRNNPRFSLTRSFAVGAVALSALALGACSDDTKDSAKTAVSNAVQDAKDATGGAVNDAAEMAVRNFAKQQGEEQFKNAGHELATDLTCEAKATTDAKHVDVNCTGQTKDGKAAVLTGQTSEFPGASITQLEGDFKGTVDGQEVFTTKKLGG